MMESIAFTKIWEDGDLVELYVQANSQCVTVKHRYYVSKQTLMNLCEQLNAFLHRQCSGFKWNSSDEGNGLCPRFTLTFSYADPCGHVIIENRMAIDDDHSSERNHECIFNIHSEIGLMDAFLKDVCSIIQ